MKILAVTACPLGVAHTYMVAEMIQQVCEKAGIECKVETQGIFGIENVITAEDVEAADVVILTTDMPIKNVERFDNIKKIMSSISLIVRETSEIIDNVIFEINKQKNEYKLWFGKN